MLAFASGMSQNYMQWHLGPWMAGASVRPEARLAAVATAPIERRWATGCIGRAVRECERLGSRSAKDLSNHLPAQVAACGPLFPISDSDSPRP
jgi:hypothetical protein